MPWEWEFLSNEPSDLSRIKFNIVWGPSDTVKGRCSGSFISLDLMGEITDNQIEESKKINWSYNKCKNESIGNKFLRFTDSCYETSRELSTLRKYKILAQYANVS